MLYARYAFYHVSYFESGDSKLNNPKQISLERR
jgi:hypothetical protein